MFLRPAKKFAAPPQKFLRFAAKFCFAPAKFAAERKILFCAAKFADLRAQKRANGFADDAAKMRNCAQKKILRRKLRNLRGSKNSRKWKP